MKELLIEVDLENSTREIICRVYRSENGHPELLRVQDICNIVQRIRTGQDTSWSDEDQKFLKQIWPFINKPHFLHSNLQVVKIPKRKFNLWLAMWKHKLNRFIEKSTQNSYTQNLESGKIHFELECLGSNSVLSAIVDLDSGELHHYHKLHQKKIGSRTEYLIDGKRIKLDLPLAKEKLDQIFGNDNRRIPTEKIVQNLATVLDYRLDLLKGPSITHLTKNERPKVRLKSDGADILVSLTLGSEMARLQGSEFKPPMKLIKKGPSFEIWFFEHPLFQKISKILSRLPLEDSFKNHFRLPGVTENIKLLYNANQELEPLIEVEIDEDLLTLLRDDSPLQSTLNLQNGKGWVNVQFQCTKGRISLEDADVLRAVQRQQEFIRTQKGEWLRLDLEFLQKMHAKANEMGLGIGQQRVTNLQSTKIIKILDENKDIRVHQNSKEILTKLRSYGDALEPLYGETLSKTLRTYQLEGANFLYNRTHFELGSLLADDMGLGKTLQVLAFLVAYKKAKKVRLKTLVVCPASVLSVWKNEIQRFTPELKSACLSGSIEQRKAQIGSINEWDVVVGSYAVIRNDVEHLKTINLDIVILDEAQQIKNPKANTTCAVKALQSTHRIALTGTPIENNLIDLWSIVDFLNPGYLGDLEDFKDRFSGHERGRNILSKKISPLVLRRLKTKVAPQLPPKTEETIYLPLSPSQLELYQKELFGSKGKLNQKGYLEVLALLTRLRQICCHPNLLKNGEKSLSETTSLKNKPHGQSAKLDFLLDRLQQLQEEGHSALVFSQFTSMLEILESKLTEKNTCTYKITGETPVNKRPQIVQEFQSNPGSAVFLLSLKAAGTGLTLTKADYVFIYDPWWNPAAENQAIDRTHRIGQDKPVIAYRLVASGTIEENIMKLKEEKQQLFSQLIDGAQNLPSKLKLNDLLAILNS